MFTLSFDPASLSEIANFFGFPSYLSSEVSAAMQQAAALFISAAQSNTWQVFENPTGALADSIQIASASPYEVIIGVSVPYAARREFGFSGMTDSLGRTFTNDPAKPYAQPALDASHDQILALIEVAAQQAFERIHGGG